MVKAVLKNGVFLPTGPVPAEWRDGQELSVQAAAHHAELDRWWADLERISAEGDPEDDRRLQAALVEKPLGDSWDELEKLCADRDPEDERLMAEAIAEHKAYAKEAMRRKMGL